jgi:hypothetical protein
MADIPLHGPLGYLTCPQENFLCGVVYKWSSVSALVTTKSWCTASKYFRSTANPCYFSLSFILVYFKLKPDRDKASHCLQDLSVILIKQTDSNIKTITKPTLKIETAGSFEKIITIYQAIHPYIPEHSFNVHCRKSLQSYCYTVRGFYCTFRVYFGLLKKPF